MKTETNILNTTDKSPEYKFPGNFRALVVDDEDPRDIGRVKVRVMGVHRESVSDEDLPWALPATSLFRSGGDNMRPSMSTDLSQKELSTAFNDTGTGGVFTVPARGNHVWVFFDMGNAMYPHYWAMAPGEQDWLTQKQYVKDKITTKVQQIQKLKDKFAPVNGVIGNQGGDWGDGSFVNARQDINSDTADKGTSDIIGGKYPKRSLNNDPHDTQGQASRNMDNVVQKPWANNITMDVKVPYDKEDAVIDHQKEPHKYDKDSKLDEGGDNGRNINRYITSYTTLGGTTIVIDTREGQENYYFIHKNYMENVDQDGSRKVFIGRNDPRNKFLKDDPTADERNLGPESSVRSNDELLVDGDKKIHVLGNFVTYIKGNAFTQVDKNIQIDVNDSCGLRIFKGDFDIILNGETDNRRDSGSEKEGAKTQQFGDMNIDIQKGHMEVHVKKNINIHAEGQANVYAGGDMRLQTKNSFHLTVEGDYNEYIKGNKFSTVKGNTEERIDGSHHKLQVAGNQFITMGGTGNLTASKTLINGNVDINGKVVASSADFPGGALGGNFVTPTVNVNNHVHSAYKGNTSPPIPAKNAKASNPSAASPGTNNGGGITEDEDQVPFNNTTGVVSSLLSTNKTIKAKRMHDKRKPRNKIATIGFAVFDAATQAVNSVVDSVTKVISNAQTTANSAKTLPGTSSIPPIDSVSTVETATATANASSTVTNQASTEQIANISSVTQGGNMPAVPMTVVGGSEGTGTLTKNAINSAVPAIPSTPIENSTTPSDAIPVV
jgi:hypothetical protein